MAVEALIFDFGGVITASPFEAFNRFEIARAQALADLGRVPGIDLTAEILA